MTWTADGNGIKQNGDTLTGAAAQAIVANFETISALVSTLNTAIASANAAIAAALRAANNLSDLANPATARANLGLGSAAVASLGVSSGDVPVLGPGGTLPAVDGSLLTNLPATPSPTPTLEQVTTVGASTDQGVTINGILALGGGTTGVLFGTDGSVYFNNTDVNPSASGAVLNLLGAFVALDRNSSIHADGSGNVAANGLWTFANIEQSSLPTPTLVSPTSASSFIGSFLNSADNWGGVGFVFSAAVGGGFGSFSLIVGGDGAAYFGEPNAGAMWMKLTEPLAEFSGGATFAGDALSFSNSSGVTFNTSSSSGSFLWTNDGTPNFYVGNNGTVSTHVNVLDLAGTGALILSQVLASTSDPHVAGQLYNVGGTVMISNG